LNGLQVFTIHGFVGEHQVPLVYVLMTRKTTNAYISVFQELKNACRNLGLQLQPPEIMTDFETGLLPAIAQEFPNTRHKGCHFHFCQV
jgi:hypothetical protein